jgi:hypothetical protein
MRAQNSVLLPSIVSVRNSIVGLISMDRSWVCFVSVSEDDLEGLFLIRSEVGLVFRLVFLAGRGSRDNPQTGNIGLQGGTGVTLLNLSQEVKELLPSQASFSDYFEQ